jgi:hypothetical protein
LHLAALKVEQGIFEEYITASADKIYESVNLTVVEIEVAIAVVAIIGVLIGEQCNIAANGIVSFILKAYSTSGKG